MSLFPPKTIFGRILLTALLPIGLLAFLLSSYAVNTRIDDLQAAFDGRGDAQARQLASVAVIGLFSGDTSMLQVACERLLDSDREIRACEIRNRDDRVAAKSYRSDGVDSGEMLREFEATVVAPVLEIDDPGTADEPVLGVVSVTFSDRAVAQARQRVKRNALLITAFSVVLALLLAILAARQIVRPIEELRAVVSRVQQGDLATRIERPTSGEIGELQSGFNSMSERIASSAQDLRGRVDQATADLRAALTELELRNVDLERSRARERDANAAKSEFLANMSHEIRTPMNGVLGFAGLLKKTRLDESQREFLDTIIRSANHLLEIINDILDFSEMESDQVRIERVLFDPREAVDDVIGLLTPQAQEKRLDLIALVESDVPERMLGDVTRLRHVLTNLVGNAVKFTQHGEVLLHARTGPVADQDPDAGADVELIVSVSDTGIGIPEEAIGGLFQPFTQGPASTRRLYGGTGLGLSIARSLVEAMGGSIALESRVGEGSRFTVRIPFDVERQRSPRETVQMAGPARRVAIVDRHPLSARALINMLTRAGFTAQHWENVPDRLEAIEPDLWLVRRPGEPTRGDIVAALSAIRRVSTAPVCLLVTVVGEDLERLLDGEPDCCAQRYPLRASLLSGAVRGLLGDDRRTAAEPSQYPESSLRLDGFIVLIADDNEINLDLTDRLLRAHGAQTLLASDGEVALRLAHRRNIDLFLVDMHMPGVDGIEFARQLRAIDRYAASPVIVLTADASVQERLVGSPFIDACLVKPLSEGLLCDVLGRVIQGVAVAPEPPSPGVPLTEGAGNARSLSVRDREAAVRIAGGDAAVADELFARLLAQLPGVLSTLHDRYGACDWERIWQLVHRLSGSVAACALPALAEALRHLEQTVSDRDVERAGSCLSRLQHEADRLVADASRESRRSQP